MVMLIWLALVIAFRGTPDAVPSGLIVGHAACGSSAFVLTERTDLIEVMVQERRVVPHTVRGLSPGDRVWGLACLADGSLWTLASSRAVVRLDRTGQVRERVDLPLPRVALFGAGDRLLVQPMPIAPAGATLISTPPREPMLVRAWPGLIARSANLREQQIARNLVNCGLGHESWLPCWFADDSRLVISDGTAAHTVDWRAPRGGAFDRSAPIRDVALAGNRRYWLLATTRRLEEREGGFLYRLREPAVEESSLPLQPPARLILSATERRCLLLTTTGALMEAAEPW
jgi:hypothetical protein